MGDNKFKRWVWWGNPREVVTWHSDGSSGAYEHGHVWKKHDMIGTHMHMVDTHGAWVYCCMGIWVA